MLYHTGFFSPPDGVENEQDEGSVSQINYFYIRQFKVNL